MRVLSGERESFRRHFARAAFDLAIVDSVLRSVGLVVGFVAVVVVHAFSFVFAAREPEP